MCTATWWRPDAELANSYSFLFNRDESKRRGLAEPPAKQVTVSGTRFIAPRDSDRGGTWLLANERGLTLAILNHYAASHQAPEMEARSRGDIPLLLADCASTNDVDTRMEPLSLTEFRPFFLLSLSPEGGPRLHEWNGIELTLKNSVSPPFTTSSFKSQQVIQYRIDQYRHMVPSTDGETGLEEYHRFMHASEGALGVRMRRPDAQTVSFSRITVNEEQIRFDYRPDPPESLEILEEST
ncbi:MAG: NRDE family protein, partial [Verrucomicrobiota bacterium]